MNEDLQNHSIDELLRDPILVVAQLKAQAKILETKKLYDLCTKQIYTLKEQLKNADYSQDTIDDICYAVCALLDETVLLHVSREIDNTDIDEWKGAPLQVIFFNTNNAGNDLFDKIRARLKEDIKNILVLQCFDRVLGLGFEGCYLHKENREREHLILALREALREIEVEQSYPIIEQTNRYHGWGRKVGLVSLTVLSVILVCLLYFILDSRLNLLLKQIVG